MMSDPDLNAVPKVIPIAVFAYNLQDSIAACLDSLYRAACDQKIVIHVLVNGCSDQTAQVVYDYASTHPEVRLIELELGDKSAAWNHYVREIAVAPTLIQAPTHVFIDGDCEALPGSISALVDALAQTPHAHAVTGVPAQGRNRQRILASLRAEHGIMGNLYALRDDFLGRLSVSGLYLPTGLIGDDSWVAALAKFDLQPGENWDNGRVAVCEDAQCWYPSLSLTRPDDIRLYHRRRIRYALRGIQTELLRQHIRMHGGMQWPTHVNELYRRYYPPALKARGLERYFDWRACRQIEGILSARPVDQG